MNEERIVHIPLPEINIINPGEVGVMKCSKTKSPQSIELRDGNRMVT